MAISRIGASSVAATSITIPGTFQAGDYMLILAFNNAAATAPTPPANWNTIQSSTLNSVGSVLAFKLASSASDVSGTWTNATSMACMVYRGTRSGGAVKATQSANGIMNANLNTNPIWQGLQPMQEAGNSWIVSFAGIKSIDTGLESGPSLLTTQTDLVTATEEICGYDSNGPAQYFTTFPPYGNPTSSLGVSVGGTAGAWHTYTIEILADVNQLKSNRGLRPHPFSPGLAR